MNYHHVKRIINYKLYIQNKYLTKVLFVKSLTFIMFIVIKINDFESIKPHDFVTVHSTMTYSLISFTIHIFFV